MRLLRISVESFGSIGRSEIELGPRLTVLYGPNDLGKSTFVEAIRCGFLLSCTSTAEEAKALRPWRSGSAPVVTLVYETEPQRIWRLRKRFDGTRGEATLESSRDGRDFQHECNGRQVEEVVRAQLAWGVPGPGGAGGGRGLPRTFLATALLAKQGQVDELLAKSLDTDADESGQQKISAALQAMAQDPLFKRILVEVQGKVDEAFTERGAWKRGKKDQVPQLSAAVGRAETAVAELEARVQSGRAVKEKLRELGASRDGKIGEIGRGREELERIRQLVAMAVALELKRAGVAKAGQALGAADDAVAAVIALEKRQGDQGRDEAVATARVASEARIVEKADAALANAREQARTMDSEATQHRIAALRAAAENRKLSAGAAMKDAGIELERAEKVGELEARLHETDEAVRAHEGKLAACRGRADQAEAERADVAGIVSLRAFEDARLQLVRAQRNAGRRDEVERDRRDVGKEAAVRSAELEGRILPAADRLVDVQRLVREAAIAEGSLSVGLGLELLPSRPLRVSVARDGGEASEEALGTPTMFEVTKQLRLVVDGVGEIIATGGTREARERARAARQRLDAALLPLLEAARAADLDALEGAMASAKALDDLRRRESRLARELADLGDVDHEVEECRERVAAAELGLQGADSARLERLSAQRLQERGRDLGERLKAFERAADTARAEARALELELGERRARHAAAVEELARIQLGTPWRDAGRAAREQREQARRELELADQELSGLEASASAGREKAQGAVRAAEDSLEQAKRALETTTAHRDALRQELAKLGGQLEERRKAAAAFDRAKLADELTAAEVALAGTSSPDRAATEAEVHDAARRLDRLDGELGQIESEIHRTEGSLTGVEGAVAEEQLAEARVALTRARERLREVQDEYEAYRLLCETLQEAQREESVHLGRVLGGPLAADFRSLAGARYESLNVSTGLRTEGVVVAGSPRELERLSVGTREQLATLFRLALARQVGSLVVLDDQLVQSDPARMAFFSRLLREVAASVQIVVLTCRATDYVGRELLPTADGPAVCDHDEIGVRVIDLGRGLVQGG